MKKASLFLALSIVFLFCSCNNPTGKTEQTKDGKITQTFNLDTSKLHTGDIFFQCSMDPEVLSDKAGECPKCSMELTGVLKK